MTTTQRVDVTVAYHGSVITFTAESDRALDWMVEHVRSEAWQWLGARTLVIDQRFAGSLAIALTGAGFRVE